MIGVRGAGADGTRIAGDDGTVYVDFEWSYKLAKDWQ